MRRGALIAGAAVLTVAAVLGLLAFLNSRDDATIGEDRVAPGKVDESLTADRLRRGNVVLLYGRAADRAPLEALAEEIAGPSDPALVEAGAAVIVERRPRGESVIANAYKRALVVESPTDPALREFAEYWLARGPVR
ncbi:MAG TPA: hypothetical protein VF529_12980 [Solirubrobacteraceae bacterium]